MLVILVAASALLTWLARSVLNSTLYFPNHASRQSPRTGRLRIPQTGGGRVDAVYLPNPAARQTLWFFHGKAEAMDDFARSLPVR